MDSNEMEQRLSDELTCVVGQLWPETPQGACETLAHQRLLALAKHSAPILLLLAEPYLDYQGASETLEDCAQLHLYARILDDAIDENLPIHRRNLLRAQPFLVALLGRLSIRYPLLWREVVDLIDETVFAAERDERSMETTYWGRKNHHLLVLPLLLSGNSACYQQSRTALSNFIWLLQATEELNQGELTRGKSSAHFLEQLNQCLEGEPLQRLAVSGWRRAAQRIVMESERLLERLAVVG